jgi:hypothetical protein
MKNQVAPICLIGMLVIFLSACQNEDLVLNAKGSGGDGPPLQINRGDGYAEPEKKLITLGEKLANPYQKDRMVEAWNKAYPNARVDNLPVTHRQITFNPTSVEQVILIQDAGIDVYNYPFGYEILNDGNYYIQPGKTEADIPQLYAVVPIDIGIPDVIDYTVEEELCLLPLETKATQEAFILAGLDYKEEIAGQLPSTPPVDVSRADFPQAILGLTKDKSPSQPGPVGRGNDYSDGDAGDAGLPSTPCGCFQWNNEDKPAGCVKVEDTQFGLQALAGVRVTFRNVFFSRRTHTDEHGCYQIDHDYWPSCHGFVHFENWFADVRSLDYNLFDTHNDPLGLYDLTGGTHINNMDIIYWRATNLESTSSSYYVAATFINSLTTFQKYCSQDGIPAPQSPLRILLTKKYSSSSAPMFTKMGASGYYSLLAGIMNPFWSGFLGTLLYPIAYPIFMGIAPDVLIGYNYTSSNSFKSDKLRSTYYHELSHTLHYRLAGNGVWAPNIEFVVNNAINNPSDPYGASGVFPFTVLDGNHKRCQLVETWANFLGAVYTHRTYGKDHHSNSNSNVCYYSWIGQLEQNKTTWYFPHGLLQDLRDQPSDYCVGALENSTVADNINHGYKVMEMYNALGTNQSVQSWRSSLPNTGQTITNMNALFNSYPYLQ